MMAALGSFLASGTFRRIVVFLLGLAVVALNKKFGLELDAESIGGVVALTIAQLVQSSMKEASVLKSASAAIAGPAASAIDPLPAVPDAPK